MLAAAATLPYALLIRCRWLSDFAEEGIYADIDIALFS
jgi:hypothetical protein